MPDEKAETVTKLLVEQFVCRYGIPVQLHSDQGRLFEASVFQQMCHLLNIRKSRTTPLHPQSDGQIERLNRTLLDLLAKMAADDKLEWDNKLPYAMSTYRSTPHTTTGETPNRLMLGREVTTPLQLLTPPPPVGPARSPWVDSLHENFSDAHQCVLAHYGKEQRVQKNYYDKRQRGLQFSEGDLVWLCVKRMKLAGPYKLNPQRWKGPFEIRKRLSATVYVIRRPGQRGTQVVNVARLAPFLQRRPDLVVSDSQPENVILYNSMELQTSSKNFRTRSEEIKPMEEEPSQASVAFSNPAEVYDMTPPLQSEPVGFIPRESSSSLYTCPIRQRKPPQRYGDVRRLSHYEEFA